MWSIMLSILGVVSFVMILKLSDLKTKTANAFRYALTILCIGFVSMFFIRVVSPEIACSIDFTEVKSITPMIYIGGLALLDYYVACRYHYFQMIKEFLIAKLVRRQVTKI